jgi:hypothetical protein
VKIGLWFVSVLVLVTIIGLLYLLIDCPLSRTSDHLFPAPFPRSFNLAGHCLRHATPSNDRTFYFEVGASADTFSPMDI